MDLINCFSGIPKYSIVPFNFKLGDIALFFMPFDKDIKICEKLKELLPYVIYQPYWVEFNTEKMDNDKVRLIEDNISYLRPFFGMEYHLSKNNVFFEGWDARMVNLFLKRKQGIKFFELNIAGLSTNSIRLMFKFLLQEMKETNCQVAYLIVDPTIHTNSDNPIFITNENWIDVYNEYFIL